MSTFMHVGMAICTNFTLHVSVNGPLYITVCISTVIYILACDG